MIIVIYMSELIYNIFVIYTLYLWFLFSIMTDFRLLSINLSYIMCENRFLLRIELKKKEREREGGATEKTFNTT